MIRINLLPVERKKKGKPLPTFVISMIMVTILSIGVLVFVFFYFNSVLGKTKRDFTANKQKIEELKNKIQEVENFEKLNKTFEDRNKLIEQLRRNQNIPVMILDEISRSIPNGVWISSMNSSGGSISIDGYAFTNTEVVAYVDNLKNSKAFTNISLQESKQTEIEKISLYNFKLTFNVRA